MVLKLQTEEGTPVHVDIPRWLFPSVFGAVIAGLSAFATAEYQQHQAIRVHEQRIEYIEATRFTSDQAREMLSRFVPREEIQASVTDRLDRIESKLDRLVESSR